MSDHKEQAKEVICLILAAAGGELKKKVALYKAFYYAHLYYWQESEGTLTDYPIVRMPQGPGIDDADRLLAELEAAGRIRIAKEQYGPYHEYSYALAQSYTIDPNDPRYRAVEKAVEFVKDKSAAELSQITHDYSRSWQQTADGEELNIYLDLLEEEEYAAMRQRLKQAEGMVNRVFAENG